MIKESVKLSHEGLEFFLRILFSCYPIDNGLSEKSIAYLQGLLEKKEEIFLAIVENELMGESSIYKQLRMFAEKEKMAVLEKKEIQIFFGGKYHYNKIVARNEEKGIPSNSIFDLHVIFFHLLIPVRIKKITEGNFEGEYLGGGKVASLLAFPSEKNLIKVGDIVLVHIATIVDCKPAQEIVEWLVAEQQCLKKFVLARKYFVKNKLVLDYAKFLRYTEKTQRMLEIYNPYLSRE